MVTYDIANVCCHTPGCANAEVTLSVYRRANGLVLCGVCGNEITDVTKTGEIELDEN